MVPGGGSAYAAGMAPLRPFANGHWVTLLVFALVLLLWIALAAEAAYQRDWVYFAGYTGITLIFLAVPTGVMRRLGRRLKGRKPGT